MGVIRNTYEEDSDTRSRVTKPYVSDCVIAVESLYERLSPSPPMSGCGHRPSTYHCDTDSSPGRSNSWPSGGGRRRGRRGGEHTSHPHYTCKHDRVHNCGHPEPDTGQEGLELPELGSKRDISRRLCCPKCGSSGYWNKSRMLRVTGRCLLLLIIIASCGSLIVNSGFKPNDPAPDLVDIVEIPLLKLHPVPLSDIRKQISNTKNYYDFFRIFLSKKDVSNEAIDDIVNARTIQKILKAREYDYSEEMPMDAEQERLDEELTEALYHQYEMDSSPLGECKTPQPEIVNVIDHENKNRIYLPECTVVYRCRNVTGCCGSAALECGPLKIQVIERSFIVMNLFNDEQALPGKDMVEKRVFINHTECGCREKQSLPDCDKKKCPYPFTMMRKGVECTCDCHQSANENNYLCQGIKDGVIPLMETDLACIKSTKCLHPVCTKGDLHIQSGHCPSIPVDEIRYPETRLAKEKDRHMRNYKQKQIYVKERELEVESEVKSDFETDIETEIGTGSGTNVEPKLVTEIESRIRSQLVSKIETEVVHQPEAEGESHVESKEKSNVEIEVETKVKPRVETELETQMKPQIETFVEKGVEAEIDPEVKSDNETASVTRKDTVTKKDTVTMTTLAQPDVNANTALNAKTAVNTAENTNPEVTTEMHANRRRWKNKNRNKWKKQKDSVLKKTEIQS